MLLTPRRLSGIRFETQPLPAAVVLPRMDVAGFVGYASSGPLDTPVPIEDPARFAELFGADVELAWDATRGEPAFGALGPAVRGFFRNGGRRCFVVRVADEGTRTTGFQLPGVVALDDGPPSHALLRARSAGTWADGLAVAVSIAVTGLLIRSVARHAGTFELVPGSSLAAGDIVRMEIGGWTLLAVVASVAGAEVTTGARLWTQPQPLPAGPLERAHWIGPSGAPRSAGVAVAGDGRLSIRTTLERGPAEGSLVRLTGGPGETWAAIGARERGGEGVLASFQALHLRRTAPAGLPRVRGAHAAERLEAELWVQGTGGRHRLGGLGFTPAHPRYLGALPTDEALFDARDVPDLWAAAQEPRFPLAGPSDLAPATLPPASPASAAPAATLPPAATAAPWAPLPTSPASGASPASAASPVPAARPLPAYFPIAVAALPDVKLPALPPAGSARRRDGLERFRASVFVDTRLEATGVAALSAQARDLARLRGLHALLDVDDVTLIAVPDAAQAGWSPETVEPAAPPVAPPPPEPGEPGAFEDCAAPSAAPNLQSAGDPATGTLALSWTAPPQGSVTVVEEAADAGFQTAAELYRGTRTELALGGRPGAAWFRARYVAGTDDGPYAVLGPVGVPARPRTLLRTPERYSADTLLAVQRALVRMCAARGDLLALLSLPEHYREDDAAAHPGALRAPFGDDERLALSYAALHHPWLVTASEERPGELRRIPPDGTLAGVAARRAAERGAWVAPANVALPDVVALSPALDPGRRLELLVAQVNVVEPTPRGFMPLAADTLCATDPDLRPVNVRRLLQLLRRLAMRDGQAYAFEPLGDALTRAAQRGFESVLGALFDLGAFSGAHPADGFRVNAYIHDDAQLVVELRVAPSRPLSFITVRLVRGGDGHVLVELAA